MPEGDPNPNPAPEEVIEAPELVSLRQALKQANDEAATRRREAKETKRLLDEATKKMQSLFGALGAENDEDYSERLGELRAAAEEKKGIADVDVKALMREKSKWDADLKRLSGERDAAAKERDDFKTSLVRFRVNDELTKGFSQHEVKPEFHEALREVLGKNVRLNEQGQPMWIVKDKNGADFDELPVTDGLKDYFEKNSHWLPPKTAPGSGTETPTKPMVGRTADVKKMFEGGVENYVKTYREGVLNEPTSVK